jgi:hypothetical protein
VRLGSLAPITPPECIVHLEQVVRIGEEDGPVNDVREPRADGIELALEVLDYPFHLGTDLAEEHSSLRMRLGRSRARVRLGQISLNGKLPRRVRGGSSEEDEIAAGRHGRAGTTGTTGTVNYPGNLSRCCVLHAAHFSSTRVGRKAR